MLSEVSTVLEWMIPSMLTAYKGNSPLISLSSSLEHLARAYTQTHPAEPRVCTLLPQPRTHPLAPFFAQQNKAEIHPLTFWWTCFPFR